MGDKRRCIYPCAFGASRHFFCGAMCSREDGHQGGCRCGVHHEPLTPPEPAAPVVGKLIIDPTPLPFRGSFDDEPAAPRPMTDADLTRAGVYAPEPAAPAPEPDEAERILVWRVRPDCSGPWLYGETIAELAQIVEDGAEAGSAYELEAVEMTRKAWKEVGDDFPGW